MGNAAFQIKTLEPKDYPLLEEFTALAVFVPQGRPAPAWPELREELAGYYQGFGRSGDLSMAACVDGAVVGMAWAREFPKDNPGYGFVEAGTPEFSLAVRPYWCGRGIGKALSQALLAALQKAGYRQVSLSVSLANHPALALYQALGFVTHAQDGDSAVMTRLLGPLD